MYNMDMNTQIYTLNQNRIFSSGNYMTYIEGQLHPDRIMNEHDFIYIVSGSWDVYQDDICYSLSAGDVLLLHAGQHHYGLTPCSPGTRTMFIHFSSVDGDAVYEQNITAQRNSNNTVSLPPKICCNGNDKVKALFEDILYALFAKSIGYEIRLNALFSLLLLELQCSQKANNFKQDEIVEKIIRLLQSNPEKHFTVKELSEMFYISEKTLCRRFVKYCSKTIYTFQNDLRLECVHQFLLKYPNATLREAAFNYGFCDEFHLSKAFKKKYGVSPKYITHSL